MTLLACGLNHKTAPLPLREQIAVVAPQVLEFSKSYPSPMVSEVALLTTCGRTEWYCATSDVNATLEWLSDQCQIEPATLAQHIYVHQNVAAVRHMMTVACGLDSMVLGEPQILGQVKQAYQQAKAYGTVGKELNALFRSVFAASKRVRKDTKIGHFPVSIAYTAVNLVKQIFPELAATRVLLIGAGETAELCARYLLQSGVSDITIANRSLANAQILAEQLQGKTITLSAIPQALVHCDVVITATTSTLPLLGKGMLETAMKLRHNRPLALIDLAVPRDIEPEVAQLPSVSLYNIDDLQTIVAENLNERRDAAKQAVQIIEHEVVRYTRWQRSLKAIAAVRHYRQQVQRAAAQEEARALAAIARGENPQQVLAELTQRLTQKALHTPSVRLRKAGYDGREDLLKLAEYLFCEK